jgi:molybdate transport system substrate-binding protein
MFKKGSFRNFVIVNLKYAGMLILLLFIITSCSSRDENRLHIATAANMQFAMQELAKSFSEDTGINCEIIVSSSGKLTAQIIEGAPFDIFVSADLKYPNELYKQGFCIDKPEVYAYGKLVIWTVNSQLKPTLKSFGKKQVKHVAIGNPKTAPYGIAALQVLKKKGIYESLKSKLVLGESIAQTNQFITTYAAQIGITAKSSVLSPRLKNKGLWEEIEEELYDPISQGVVILKNRNGQIEKAKRFKDFLFSVKGKEILDKFGYSVDD